MLRRPMWEEFLAQVTQAKIHWDKRLRGTSIRRVRRVGGGGRRGGTNDDGATGARATAALTNWTGEVEMGACVLVPPTS